MPAWSAHGARRVDEGLLTHPQGLAANDACQIQPEHGAEADEQQVRIAAEHHHQQDHQQHERNA
jgi:hypothetical protein